MEKLIDRRQEDIEETKDYLEPGYKVPENKVPENKVPENKVPENKVAENKVAENNVVENNVAEEKDFKPEFSEKKPININTGEGEDSGLNEEEEDIDGSKGELKEVMRDISRLPECKMKIPQNQQICEEYKQFIHNSPLTLENTEVIDSINIISENKLKSWIKDNLTQKQEEDLREKEKHKFLEKYFDVPPNLLQILENIYALSNKIRQEDVVYEDIVFNETELKGTKNLLDFLMNAMYFQMSYLFNFNLKTNLDPTINPKPDTTSILNTKVLKGQIGKDILRIGKPININGVDILQADINKFKSDFGRCDFYNQILMDFMDKYDLTIDKNIITIIDICSIQQIISLLSDTFVHSISKLELLQGGTKRDYSYTIVLTEEEKYIIISLKQHFISLKNLNSYSDLRDIPDSGELITKLKINLNNINYNLSYDSDNNDISNYSLFVSFNIKGDTIPLIDSSKLIEEQNRRRFLRDQQNNDDNYDQSSISDLTDNSDSLAEYLQQFRRNGYVQNIRNAGSNAVEYAKENPGSVAAAAGVSSVLAAGVGTILALGLLGGKTKKRLHKKRLTKNNKFKGKRKGSKKRKRKITKRQINTKHVINKKLTKRKLKKYRNHSKKHINKL